jgi:hypothetical protein
MAKRRKSHGKKRKSYGKRRRALAAKKGWRKRKSRGR